MAKNRPLSHEVPPTAGLPPRWSDLRPRSARYVADEDLGARAAAFLRTPSVQVECSGTASLVVVLHAMHRLSGRRAVVVPAYTCPLVALAVAQCGLELRVCDLAADSLDFDRAGLERVCDHETLAVMPTHLGGRVVDVAAACEVARSCGAFVIEDAAQALGATQGSEPVGFLGDAGFFSLAVGKGLTTYEGGLLVARDAALRTEFARTSERMIAYRRGWEWRRSLELIAYHAFYRPALLGIAYGAPLRRALRRGDAVAAVGDDFSLPIPLHTLGVWRRAVGARAFARLDGFLSGNAERARRRLPRLRAIAGVEVFGDPAGAVGTWPFLWLRLASADLRDAVLDRLWGAGLGVSRLFIHALPDYDYLAGIVGTHEVPNARALAACSLTISNSEWLGEEEFESICATIEEVVGGR